MNDCFSHSPSSLTGLLLLIIMYIGTKEFLCITHAVEHNYISPSSTVGIQLHVSVLYVGHLQVVI